MIKIAKMILAPLSWIGIAVYLACWLIEASFQWNADFYRHRFPAGDMTVPVQAKGITVYLTAQQAFWYNLSSRWIFVAFALGVGSAGLFNFLTKREAARKPD